MAFFYAQKSLVNRGEKFMLSAAEVSPSRIAFRLSAILPDYLFKSKALTILVNDNHALK